MSCAHHVIRGKAGEDEWRVAVKLYGGMSAGRAERYFKELNP